MGTKSWGQRDGDWDGGLGVEVQGWGLGWEGSNGGEKVEAGMRAQEWGHRNGGRDEGTGMEAGMGAGMGAQVGGTVWLG